MKINIAIVGAGISGTNTAYYIDNQELLGTSYAILEARSDLGGTCDFFPLSRYPIGLGYIHLWVQLESMDW